MAATTRTRNRSAIAVAQSRATRRRTYDLRTIRSLQKLGVVAPAVTSSADIVDLRLERLRRELREMGIFQDSRHQLLGPQGPRR